LKLVIFPTNPTQLQSISKDRAVAQAGSPNTPGIGGTIEILQLDADGNTDDANVLEKWTLRNAWVSKIQPSELSYDSEDLSTIEVELVYDWAELKTKGQAPLHAISEDTFLP